MMNEEATMDKTEPQVNVAITRQFEISSNAQVLLNTLFERLEKSVLSPAPERPADTVATCPDKVLSEKASQPRSPLVVTIDNQTERIAILCELLRDILNRLQV